ncbi:hypothetical protein [Mycolicibacterium frederiksbergense]
MATRDLDVIDYELRLLTAARCLIVKEGGSRPDPTAIDERRTR